MTLPKTKRQDPVAWCEQNIQLDYGNFKRENHPLLVDVLRAAAESRGAYVGLIGSVQHIKTLTAQLLQLYSLHVSPASSAHYDLTGDALKEFSDDKFTPLIDSTERILKLIPDQKYRKTKLYTSTPLGHVRLLSANVLANRNSKTLERITADESWAYKDEEKWLEQIHSRQNSFNWQWQMFLPSSGQTEGSELDQLWQRSSQHTWHVKCPCCGEEIPYIWKQAPVDGKVPPGGIQYASRDEVTNAEGEIDWLALRESVYYQCQLCEGRIDWDPGAQHERNLTGRYIQMNSNPDPQCVFYHYNALAHAPWPELVTKWKRATIARSRGDLSGLEEFVRKQLAQPWNESNYVSAEKIEHARGDYVLGEKWEPNGSEPIMFATVDVQKDHFYVIVRAWSIIEGELHSRLIEREKVYSSGAIRDIADKYGLAGATMSRVFLDGNYNSIQVQRLAAENYWIVFRGDNARDYRHGDGLRRIYAETDYIDVGEGTIGAGRKLVPQIRFSSNEALNRLSLIRGIKGRNDQPVWTYAKDAGAIYERQINAWQKISKTKPSGEVYYDFINRDSHNDHFGDCEKMNIVCAAMAGLIGFDSEPQQKVENNTI